MSVVHVEIERGEAFCGEYALVEGWEDVVGFTDWRESPEAIQRATCEQCLLRIFMLGDSAQIALARMGRKIEAVNAPAEVEAS